MQKNPEKIIGNYNEYVSQKPFEGLLSGNVSLQKFTDEKLDVIETGRRVINEKINEILGSNNHLTKEDLAPPEVEFMANDPEHPTRAGFFHPVKNRIGIILDKAPDKLSQLKVYIHEYIHFISHNGFDESEGLTDQRPLARNNNVGFQRYFGLDIRKGRESEITGDYFLAFNEAVTEQLAIDILPGVLEAYPGYRGLLNQVIDDAVTRKLGNSDTDNSFKPWPRDQIKNYIYWCFLSGHLEGFTNLLQSIYDKYDISEQQFGLMTDRSDLPSVVESSLRTNRPSDPPPSPQQVAVMVQIRLDNKTPDDYKTDVVGPDDDDRGIQGKYGQEYDIYLKGHNIVVTHIENINGKDCEVDSHGLIVYRGEEALLILDSIRATFDELLKKAAAGEIQPSFINECMDKLLFEECGISMLSDGFRNFYIYKHSKLDSLKN